ncbi:unnamed protein product [Pseudo-nitzschia multistriata]|uniref:Uncharacterized protein n=1 Tax=Pseudo-nitzschia multistriata TaxID=183589 RepID=A0A448Z2C1_9STRA|nr:unnamed protein product [Pseudo-nitzschia multistriata]
MNVTGRSSAILLPRTRNSNCSRWPLRPSGSERRRLRGERGEYSHTVQTTASCWYHRSSYSYDQHYRNPYTSVVLSNVYPDVSASAACVRTNSIVHGLAALGTKKQKKIPRVTNSYMDGPTPSIDGNDCDDDREQRTISGTINPNRVYYATSVDLQGKDKNPFGTNPAIRMMHLPPNQSDRMETLVAAITDEKKMKLVTDAFDDNQNTANQNTSFHLDDDDDDDQNDACIENNGDHCKNDKYNYNYFDANTTVDRNTVDLVVFDRFFMEEAHSFRFRQQFPSAALVLDMQDMHSLRWSRQKIVQEWDKKERQQKLQNRDPFGCLPEVLNCLPSMDKADRDDHARLIRELASIHRSDLVLVCSPVELKLLTTVYKVPKQKLCLASFFVAPPPEESDANINRCYFENYLSSPPPPNTIQPRFVFCGGFKHEPNADAVRILIDFVWPRVRKQLPEATLHIYGAFCPDHLLQINDRNKSKNKTSSTRGITVYGFEPDLAKIFGANSSRNSILLAPLRFGAGIKGKIIDAWTFGMPVVTTPIGSEGMTMTKREEMAPNSDPLFGGRIASTLEEFCANAIELATDPVAREEAKTNGRFLLANLFAASQNWECVENRLLEILQKNSDGGEVLSEQRRGDYTQAMLWHQSLRSTEYFSRWVELKESIRRTEKES